ncbi:hypothetical protein DKX38_002045 [Salix brachista]|uniref:Uncharacterized protein n=1 Tax=Salix brachista TaxID=2182728 RepID=A0A5N5NLQ6_9ROSI|nr:hypothetical protein DKX38_002045 [Salix brachista]
MCTYAGGLYAETFALIVDVTIVLFSVYLCTHLKACLALYVKDRHYILWRSLEFTYALAVPTSLARESSQTWHPGMILHGVAVLWGCGAGAFAYIGAEELIKLSFILKDHGFW